MTPNKSDQKPKSYRMNRRRLLQMTGVGVGTLTMTAVGGDTAIAQSTCANGPFERTYEAETINISKVANNRRNHDKAEEYPPAAEGAMDRAEITRESVSPPPASGAQRPPTSDELLGVGTEYDGVRDQFFIELQITPTMTSIHRVLDDREQS